MLLGAKAQNLSPVMLEIKMGKEAESGEIKKMEAVA